MTTILTVPASDPIRDYLSSIGRKGGLATRASLTPAQRSRSAQKAALARWRKLKRRNQ